MRTTEFRNVATEDRTRLAVETDPLWYAAYTVANHEKRVAEQLGVRSVEHFVPLYESVRRWKDRKVRLQLPLFPGYVFVRLALRDWLRALPVPGVAPLVGLIRRPSVVAVAETGALKRCTAIRGR